MNTNTIPALDPTKPVRCRNGNSAEIFTVDRECAMYPIFGRLKLAGGQWLPACWCIDGRRLGSRDLSEDLVNIPREGEFWVNVYPPDDLRPVHCYRSRKSADAAAAPHRIACVHVPWVEGMGLADEKDNSEAARAEMTEQERGDTAAALAGALPVGLPGERASATSPMGRCVPRFEGPLAGRQSEDCRKVDSGVVPLSWPPKADCQGEATGALVGSSAPIVDELPCVRELRAEVEEVEYVTAHRSGPEGQSIRIDWTSGRQVLDHIRELRAVAKWRAADGA